MDESTIFLTDLSKAARQWKTFYGGLLTHEKVRGIYASQAVAQIINTMVGLTVQNGPKYRKIRIQVLEQVKAAYGDYKAKTGCSTGPRWGQAGKCRG